MTEIGMEYDLIFGKRRFMLKPEERFDESFGKYFGAEIESARVTIYFQSLQKTELGLQLCKSAKYHFVFASPTTYNAHRSTEFFVVDPHTSKTPVRIRHSELEEKCRIMKIGKTTEAEFREYIEAFHVEDD